MNPSGSSAAKATPPRVGAAAWGAAGVAGLRHSQVFRGLVYQALVIAALVGAGAYLVNNALDAMARRGISTGFGFLAQEAGFAVGESLIRYAESDTYLRAYLVGIANTLKVSVLGIGLATVLGTIMGIARLSSNWLVAALARAYVEVFRNTPQLLQIVVWWTALHHLPRPRQALSPMGGVYLSNRGLALPWPIYDPAHAWMLAAFAAGCLGAWGLARLARRRQALTGRRPAVLWLQLALALGPPLLAWWLGGAPAAFDRPELKGFNYWGGLTLSPEFLALLFGLALYIGAFIAEIVRSGIQSVHRGQVEAARALGLTPGQITRWVVIPQALRVMVPPAAAQYVSLVKNSSLAVAIGYPDVVNVANTTITQSGHTIEVIGMIVAVYLSISFLIALLMNWYNRVVQVKER